MAKDKSWIGIVAAIGIGFLVMSCSDAQAEEREEKRSAEIEAVYAEAYEAGRQDAIEEIKSYINRKGADAFRPLVVEFCCPNPYCQALIEYHHGDLPEVVAYRGYAGWEDVCGIYLEFDY